MTTPVVALKLASGEEVIGRPVDGRPNELSHPFVVGLTPQGLSMMPFLPYASDEALQAVTFNINHIVTTAEVNQALADLYIERVSGIAVTRSPIVSAR